MAVLQAGHAPNVIQKLAERYNQAFPTTPMLHCQRKCGWGCVSRGDRYLAWMDVVATQYILGIVPP